MDQTTTAASARADATQAAGHPPTAPPLRIAVIASAWHREIVASATLAIQVEFELGPAPNPVVQQFEVPGAYELPLLAQRLARGGGFDAIIACGLVVNGGIYRHEFVAAAVIDGLMRVQLDADLPVLSCVLTPRDFHEHDSHRQFFHQHLHTKGQEVARSCLQTLASLPPRRSA